MRAESAQPIILFDGVCNLCNSSVQFIINRDPEARFKFTSLQSDTGIELLTKHKIPANKLQSVILIENNQVFDRSGAALRIAKKLSGGWPLLYLFIVIPPFIRNAVYDFIASNRYKWFGKRNECMIPTPELKSRFI